MQVSASEKIYLSESCFVLLCVYIMGYPIKLFTVHGHHVGFSPEISQL